MKGEGLRREGVKEPKKSSAKGVRMVSGNKKWGNLS